MEDLLQQIKIRFPYLSEAKLMEILNNVEVMELNEGGVFVHAGDRTHKIGVVIKGMMRNFIVNDNGEEVTVVFATEMQAIAPFSTVFLDKPASETSAAVEPTILLVVDFKEFRAKAMVDPDYMRLYIEGMESILLAAIERIEDFTKKKPEQRYQRLLDHHGFLIERAPLKYLASYLGITPVSLSRIRKRLASNK